MFGLVLLCWVGDESRWPSRAWLQYRRGGVDNGATQAKPSAMNDSTHLPPPPPGKELVLRVLPMPSDANYNGDIFGGWIMSQVDLGGAVLPARHSGGRVTTVAVKEFVFKEPVQIGDLLSIYAAITRVGRTSMTVSVEVWAERFRERDETGCNLDVKVTEAELTYVAIDRHGNKRTVPPLPAPAPTQTKG